MTTATKFDFAAFRRALERVDVKGIAETFAEDGEWIEIDSRTPPASPTVLRGREAITRLGEHVATLGLDIRVYDEVIGDGRVAYSTECTYPDGKRVMATATLEIDGDGRVAKLREVQVFDE
jgi:ketosteroid isomerase-like protein